MIIQSSQATICLKTGCVFSMAADDRVFTGDLFFDLLGRKFQMRGIPSLHGQMNHILNKADKGPFRLMLFIENALESEIRADGRHIDLTFRKARCTSALATFIEEYHSKDNLVMQTIEDEWTVVPNLTWTK